MDFTLNKYSELLQALTTSGKKFSLRHDVDLKPENSLATARIESQHGLQATYYFRAVPESWNERIIKEISALGHEIGYHYECLTTCNGNMELAWEDFKKNLKDRPPLGRLESKCPRQNSRMAGKVAGTGSRIPYHRRNHPVAQVQQHSTTPHHNLHYHPSTAMVKQSNPMAQGTGHAEFEKHCQSDSCEKTKITYNHSIFFVPL